MTKAIATVALLVIQIGLVFGNYWYTFGLWPRSWVSFVGFAICIITVSRLNELVQKSPQ